MSSTLNSQTTTFITLWLAGWKENMVILNCMGESLETHSCSR